MAKSEWHGKRVLILGLGQYPQGSGISAALFFARQNADVLVTDQKTEAELASNVKRLKKFKNVRFAMGGHRLSDIRWADVIIRNPRVRPSSPEMKLASKLGKRVESDVSIFMAACPSPIIGITGTRGKSTTSTLVAEMLKKSGTRVWLGGNILVSPLTFLSKVKKSDMVVLELSSWQLETTGAAGMSPQFAMVTNLMRDHLNSYEGMEDYAEAKAQIFRHQDADGVVILNADDGYGRRFIEEAPGRVIKIGNGTSDGHVKKEIITWKDPKSGKTATLVKRSQLKMLGEHNATNVLLAALLARAAGASVAAIRSVAKSFSGLHDRLELIATKRGIRFVNDTTATTADATIAALRALSREAKTIHLIAGGADKELEFDELAQEIKKKHVCVSVFPGTAHEKLTGVLMKRNVAYLDVASMKEAVHFHRSHAVKGDVILLSPGCASFGLFANEFDRGNQFKKLVHAIK